ncbi:DUF4157 domain-containing protein [Mesorhizobium australicum]|uniref:DUF4157 domain-containing protein n=1 Tax=Mesorhizobium australicum TaxID=536018 RepID=UPI00333B56D5
MRRPFVNTWIAGGGIVLSLFSSSVYACGAFDIGCELQETVQNPGEKLRQGADNLQQAVRQGQQNVTNTLDLVDPRISQAGRDIDRWRLNLQSQVLTGPVLEQWIIQSRNDAINGAQPMPDSIKRYMQGWYSDAQMANVYYKIGDSGSFNLANNSIRYGEAEAVTLIDVIVFRDADTANDLAVWAHELKHITQYQDWGVHSFAVQYMRSWNSVEDPAYQVGNQYAGAFNSAANQFSNAAQQIPNQPQYSQICIVGPLPTDRCWMNQAFPVNTNCGCPAPDRVWYGTVGF